MDRGRLEAFSDGVFAVAITLLALDLVLPGPGSHHSLWQLLSDHWRHFVAYFISFLTIGIMWVNHHALVRNIAVVDRTVLFLNLMLLLFVVVIPFSTSTMAEYLTAGGGNAHLAMALYASAFEATALAFTALFLWTLKEGRTHRALPREARGAAAWRFSFGSFVYIVAIVVSFINAHAAFVLIGLVAVYYVFERTPAGPVAGTEGEG
jgi:uncharacterized membrane protein